MVEAHEIILGVLTLGIVTTGIPVNVTLIMMLHGRIKNKARTANGQYVISDVLLISLFLTGIIQSLFSCPIVAANFFQLNIGYSCNITSYPVFAMANSSLMHIALLSLHRLILTKFPLFGRLVNNNIKLAILGSSISWAYGFVIASPPLYGWSRYVRRGNSCTLDWITRSPKNLTYVSFAFMVSFLIPFALLVITTHKYFIFGTVPTKKSSKVGPSEILKINVHHPNIRDEKTRESPSPTREVDQIVNVETENSSEPSAGTSTYRFKNLYQANLKKKQSIFITQKKDEYARYRKSCAAILAVFIIVWFPYALFSFLLVFGVPVSDTIYDVTSVFGKSSSLFLPLAHGVIYRRIKRLKGQGSATE